jgi:hypothetical protein
MDEYLNFSIFEYGCGLAGYLDDSGNGFGDGLGDAGCHDGCGFGDGDGYLNDNSSGDGYGYSLLLKESIRLKYNG